LLIWGHTRGSQNREPGDVKDDGEEDVLEGLKLFGLIIIVAFFRV